MTAVVQEGFGSADVLHLRHVPIPDPDDDAVLVRVHATSINFFDYGLVRNGRLVSVIAKLMRRRIAVQGIRGVDLAGTVEAIGKDVTAFGPGDEVMGIARAAWAEYASTRESRLVPKPTNASFIEAAAVGNAGVTALHAVRDGAKLTAGQRVLVYGAGGGVGTFTLQLAKAFGAHVTAVTHTRSVDLVRSLGPDALLDYTRDDVARRPERYDVVFDIAGTYPLGRLLRLLAPGGKLVLVGSAKSSLAALVWRLGSAQIRRRVLRQPVSIVTAKLLHEDLLLLKELIEAGKIRPAIDRTYPLAEARDAVRYAMTGQARAKVVITID